MKTPIENRSAALYNRYGGDFFKIRITDRGLRYAHREVQSSFIKGFHAQKIDCQVFNLTASVSLSSGLRSLYPCSAPDNLFYSSFSLPSSVTVTTCHGMNFPLFFRAVTAARSNPPQQGTSMRTTVTLLTSFSLMISVSFSA